MFNTGDRVQLATPVVSSGCQPAGTVIGFVTPEFAAHVDAPDDILVRWDSGPELQHAPIALQAAPDHG